jgi:two-component system, LuxR family, response regulator FixJ
MSPGAIRFGSEERSGATGRIVYVVDDESEVRRSIGFFLKSVGYLPRPYLDGADFLTDAPDLEPGCVLLDVRMPGLDGLQLLERMGSSRRRFAFIVMTGHGDVATAVRAMKLGAVDFLEKPFEDEVLVACLERASAMLARDTDAERDRRDAERLLAALTPRERDVLMLLSEGKSNKEVAIALGLSVRTVEMHRATMFERLGVRTLPEAMKLAFRARADLTPAIS